MDLFIFKDPRGHGSIYFVLLSIALYYFVLEPFFVLLRDKLVVKNVLHTERQPGPA